MWQPSASLDNLRNRARVLGIIRQFFASRDVMEVETPLLCHTSVTSPYIQSIPVLFQAHPQAEEQRYYLQTSPEYAMKRLLAAGSGPIYQISKAFRQGEVGRFHNPEFTMLEWYRPHYDHHDLMDEMDLLLQATLNTDPAERVSYANLFLDYLQIDIHTVKLEMLATCAQKNNLDIKDPISDRDTWLQLLLSHCIEPKLGADRPIFIYDFPATQAALARLHPDNPKLASRFEVYYRGLELANGFHELQDATEQRKRFENDLTERAHLGLADILIDEHLLSALTHGLPDCAGVALGIDRLMMLASDSGHIREILSFDFERV